jgi:hypothetical protein
MDPLRVLRAMAGRVIAFSQGVEFLHRPILDPIYRFPSEFPPPGIDRRARDLVSCWPYQRPKPWIDREFVGELGRLVSSSS